MIGYFVRAGEPNFPYSYSYIPRLACGQYSQCYSLGAAAMQPLATTTVVTCFEFSVYVRLTFIYYCSLVVFFQCGYYVSVHFAQIQVLIIASVSSIVLCCNSNTALNFFTTD